MPMKLQIRIKNPIMLTQITQIRTIIPTNTLLIKSQLIHMITIKTFSIIIFKTPSNIRPTMNANTVVFNAPESVSVISAFQIVPVFSVEITIS